MLKRCVLTCSAVILLAGLLVGGSASAFFTDAASPEPRAFTTGTFGIKVTAETKDAPEAGERQAEWTVENTGTVSAYLRAEIEADWEKPDGKEDGTENRKKSLKADPPKLDFQSVSGWILKSDGYYYYCGERKSPIAVEPRDSVPFSCSFGVKGGGGSYRLTLTLAAEGVSSQAAWK